MTFKRLLIFLAAASIGKAAITELYVNVAGSGSGDGSSEANAMSLATFDDYLTTGGSVNATAGDRFNVDTGTYAQTTSVDTWVNGGTATSPVIIRGYASAIGDGYLGRTNDNGALITTNMPLFTYTTGTPNVTGNFFVFESINFSSTRNGGAFVMAGTDNVLRGCVIANATSGASGRCLEIQGRGTAFDCDFSLTNGGNAGEVGVAVTVVGAKVIGCRINSTAVGVSTTSAALVVAGCTFYTCTGNAISVAATGAYTTIIGNTFVGGGADAINIVTGSTIQHVILNNMITDQTGGGIDMVSTGNSALVGYNRLRDNAASFQNGGDWITATSWGQASTDTGTTGTTATDYVNYAGGDYNLVSGSPATSAGIPLKASIGALQRDQVSSGGGQTSNAFAK
jgi:hypothetical protein